MLGVYALLAEWQALMDPAADSNVAHLKLAWWQEEMRRLVERRAVHPISGYLAALPHADAVDFAPLVAAVDAAVTQIGGAPLERGADLEAQSQTLWGKPLAVVSRLAYAAPSEPKLDDCTTALAAADYLARAISDYRRDARRGRVSFALDELMTAGVGNADLAADPVPPHLQRYLDQMRGRAAHYFAVAANSLPRSQHSSHRHLLVLAALGLKHLNGGVSVPQRRTLKDMLLAWTTARQANR